MLRYRESMAQMHMQAAGVARVARPDRTELGGLGVETQVRALERQEVQRTYHHSRPSVHRGPLASALVPLSVAYSPLSLRLALSLHHPLIPTQPVISWTSSHPHPLPLLPFFLLFYSHHNHCRIVDPNLCWSWK